MIPTPARRGFTLFQLLIIIALLALLLALFLPATIHLRMSAMRIQSQNNLKQIALAIHAYHDTNNTMPAGVTKTGFSVSAQVLPYIEQAALYQQINFMTTPDNKLNTAARNTRIKTYMSPLDMTPIMGDSGPTNYVYCAGAKPDLKNNDGMFFAESKTRFPDVTDGTSNTVMVGETLRGDGGVRAMNVARQHVELAANALQGIKADTGVTAWKADKNIVADRCAAWIEGKFLQGTFTATLAFNDEKPDINCAGLGGLSALRTPTGTVQVGMGDGSVRSINLTLNLQTWQALCTRNGGEVVGDF